MYLLLAFTSPGGVIMVLDSLVRFYFCSPVVGGGVEY